MLYEVRYLADDGEIRWMSVEADSVEEAKEKAWENDSSIWCGDSINKIVDVQ